MSKSIGHVNYEAWLKRAQDRGLRAEYPEWAEAINKGAEYPGDFETGAKASILHALDMLHKAGVPPDTAAIRLRRGETLEAICEVPTLVSGSLTREESAKAIKAFITPCKDHKPEPGAYGGLSTMRSRGLSRGADQRCDEGETVGRSG